MPTVCTIIGTYAGSVELLSASQWPTGVQTVGAGKPFTDTAAKWIWITAGAQSNASMVLRPTFHKTLTFAKPGEVALLNIIPDDVADIYLNGIFLATVSRGWLLADYVNRPVRLSLVQGTNLLSVRVTNTGGSAGLLASITDNDPKSSTIWARTDLSWVYTYETMNANPSEGHGL
jgi:hypothetical protein